MAYLLCRMLVMSRLGRVVQAIRDAEGRVVFSGYNPIHYKQFVWVVSALLCGVAGALYVPQVGIINPSEMHPANSIEMAIWVAVGGRGTLVGAILGAFIVNAAKSWFTAAFPDLWLFVLGAMFIAVTLFLPRGVIGLFDFRALSGRIAAWIPGWPAVPPAVSPLSPGPSPRASRER
jgi:urea transport system permease protein